MFDIFSCKMFDFERIRTSILTQMATIESFVVIPRGTKHKENKAHNKSIKTLSSKAQAYNSAWKDNIIK
jgi:hypothetical protein